MSSLEANTEKAEAVHAETTSTAEQSPNKLKTKLRAHVRNPNIHIFHRLDPLMTPKEERKLDRSNLGNAVLMDIKDAVSLDSAKYSLAIPIFFAPTCIGKHGNNLGMQFMRPSVRVTSAMLIWGSIPTMMAAASNAAGITIL